MALRFPGAETPEEFWADIRAGKSRIHRFTDAELAAAGIPRSEREAPDFVGVSGTLPGIDRFDAEFFGMSAREAETTDPQHRLLLECCHHALEDGGYAVPDEDIRIGVYASIGYRLHSLHAYLTNNLATAGWKPDWTTAKQAQIGNYGDFAATQVAYRLGLTGPAINVATACSSSLVGVHLACQALLFSDADLTIVGSSALHLPQVTGHRAVKGSTMSPTGVLRAFDADADGTVAGNGVAAVLLKRLDRALADGDTVYATILGSGVTNDGADKAGFTAPSAAGQRDAVLRAAEAAGVSLASIGYVEAHGTGTRKGDPIEFSGLTMAFRQHTERRNFCALGTVKPRIGHLDSCAGMAGLISAILTLRHGVIPPLVNFRRPNPMLDLAVSPFTLSGQTGEWTGDGPRRASVHSVGMGGTNAHVILEQPPTAPPPRRPRLAAPGMLPLSARDPEALREHASAIRDHLREHPDTKLADLVTTMARGRRSFPYRLAIPGHSAEELAEALDGYLSNSPGHRCTTGVVTGNSGFGERAPVSSEKELARLYCQGAEIDWLSVLDGCEGRRISLPGYPFRRKRHWTGPRPMPDIADPGTGRPAQEEVMADQEVLDHVRVVTARYLGCAPAEIDPERALVELGADSLQLIGMQVELEGEYEIKIGMSELLEVARTPRLIAELIVERRITVLAPPAEEAAATRQAEPPSKSIVDSSTEAVAHGPRVILPAESGMAESASGPSQRGHVEDLTRRLSERTRKSKESTQRYRKVLADSRAVVGFRAATKEMRYPIVGRSAGGARLVDLDGNEYVDITMGFGALLLGHEPECVTDAVREHLSRGLQFGTRSEDTGETASLLAEVTKMERVAFACSGTEANSAAIRLARAATGRDRIVTFRGSYHGHLDLVLGRPGGQTTVPVSPGIPASAVSDLTVLEYGDPRSLEIIEQNAGTIAAVLVEPVQCRNPALRPAEFVRSLRELTRRQGIVLIFDEMLTGLRPHPGGAQHHYGVVADLATYGKALGSGFPIGAIAGRAEIMDGVDGGFWRYGDDSRPQRETVFFGGTYLQHPVSMAAARAVLTHLRQEGPRLQETLNARTDRLATELNRFFVDEEFPLRLDHFGSMFRFTHRADMELLYHHLLLRGVHVWEWRSFYLSTAHTDTDIEFIADAVRDSLRELRTAGFFPTTKPLPVPKPAPRKRPAPDFSIYFFGDCAESVESPNKYDLILDTARFADEHDFHALWLPERHFHSFGGLFPNPAVLAAVLAARTSRIRLNAGSVVLPLHDPIRVAEEWSVVDNVSGGRVGLGFGTGWHANDFALLPGRFAQRREITFDHLAELRRLWRGESLRRRSGTGAEIDVSIQPRPIQAQPPMWLATTGRGESYDQAARHDLGVLTNLMNQTVEQLAANISRYRRARLAHGLDPYAGRVTVLLHTYLDDDQATARADALEPMVRYLRSSLMMRSAAAVSGRSAEDLAAASPAALDELFRHAYERYCNERALIGTPQSCRPLLAALHAAGVDEIAAFVDFGLPAERVASGLVRLDRLRRDISNTEPSFERVTVSPKPEEAEGPATPAQRRVWLACQLTGPSAYNEVQAARLRGPLDEMALRTAVRGLVDRHPGLRVRFRADGQELMQVVANRVEVPLLVSDQHNLNPESAIAEVVREESRREYDLARGPLLTPRLLRLGVDDHALVLGIHHLITDGHSAGIIAKDLQELYQAAVTGAEPRFARPCGSPLDADHPGYQADDLDWWRARLGAKPAVLRLPTDRARADATAGAGASVSTWFDAERTAALREWSSEQGVTLFASLLTAWQVVLRRFSGQDEFVVGTTFGQRSGRTRDTIGFFVALLPLPMAVRDETETRTAVQNTRDALLGAAEHSRVDVDALLAEVNPTPGAVRPLMPVSADLDTESLPTITLPGLRAEPVAAGTESAPLELSLNATRVGQGLRLRIRYDTGLYDERTVTRYLEQLQLILDVMASRSSKRIGDLPTLTPRDERDLRSIAGGQSPLPHQPVLTSHRPAGDRPVVIDASGRHDGHALRIAAEGVTAQLTESNTPRGAVVAVALPRGHEFLAAVLGTVAAGAAYLPLDLSQPRPRLAAIFADAAPSALICAADLDPELAPGVLRLRVGRPGRAEAVTVTGDDLLCLLYTSGSTGTPKGVLIEHRNLAATLSVFLDRLGISEDDRLSWYSATSFDAGHIELWPALATGAELHVVPDEVRLDPPALVAWLVRQRITVAFLPTAVAEAVLEQPWPHDTALRVLCTGGERLHSRPRPDIPFTLFNIYGPTECSVFCCWDEVSPEGTGTPALGNPNPGLWFEVRDPAGRVLPPGAVGELHVAGSQVVRGYHGDRQLTERRFSTDGQGRRWYRTGDLVRWRTEGKLDFVGRADDQVQIRGVRVEPAEVTRAVRRLPGVRDARVLAETDESTGRDLLVCYVLDERSQSGGTGDAEWARCRRAELANLLPRPMVPERWLMVDELPLTSHGKWDLRTLEDAREEEADGHIAEMVRQEWAEVLGTREFDDRSRFFDLGGHSLKAVALLNRIKARFATDYSLAAFFADPTVHGMLSRLSEHNLDEAPVSMQQEALLEAIAHAPKPQVWNVPTRIWLTGPLDVSALRTAIGELIKRHIALRCRFIRDDGGLWRQQELVPPQLSLPVEDLRHLPTELREKRAEELCQALADTPFDLTQSTVPVCLLLRMNTEHTALMMVTHHISTDGWARSLVLRELAELYTLAATGAPPRLTTPGGQCTDYARWQHEQQDQDPALERHRLTFWRQHLDGLPLTLDLPTDRPRPAQPSGAGGTIRLEVPHATRAAVEAFATARGTTPFAVIAAGFGRWLATLSRARHVVLGMSYANRERREFESTVSCTRFQLGLRVVEAQETPFATLVDQVAAEVTIAIDHAMPVGRVLRDLVAIGRTDVPGQLSAGIAFQNLVSPAPVFSGLSVRTEDVAATASRQDLLLGLVPVDVPNGGYQAWLEYSTDLWFPETAAGLLRDYLDSLFAVCS